MTNDEWRERYDQRFRDVAGWEGSYSEDSDTDIDEVREGFEEDPEGAADEEMSYWENDGDDEES